MDLGAPIRTFPLRRFRGLYIACGVIVALTVVGAIRSGAPAMLIFGAVAAFFAFVWTYREYRSLEIFTGGIVLRTMLARYEAPWSAVTVERLHGGPLKSRLAIRIERDGVVVEHPLFEAKHDGFFTIKREYRGRALLDEIQQAIAAARPAA